MNSKKIENVSTRTGVVLLAMLAVFGILACLEIVFDIDFFRTRRSADIWTVIPLITCVLIFCCFLVSTMLNISRIAESVERVAEHNSKTERAE